MNAQLVLVRMVMLFITLCLPVHLYANSVGNNINAFESIADFQPILSDMADKRLVLLGESTHGTAEFYEKRAAISKALITDHGFDFIAVEGDWASLAQLNMYVKHHVDGPKNLEQAMDHLQRWPQWMWHNAEVQDLISWLREYNQELPAEDRIGFYGIDVYADELAAQDVIDYFQERDAHTAARVTALYQCKYRHESLLAYLEYVWNNRQHCGEEIAEVLEMVQQGEGFDPSNWTDFRAEQAALVVKNAEWHYRGEIEGGALSWNRRANHFFVTAERLLEYYGEQSQGIVWAHNTHIGDARATSMARHGMINIGQIARERLGGEATYALGFGTYRGEVLAALGWEEVMQTMTITEARADSWEAKLNNFGLPQLWIQFNVEKPIEELQIPIQHRAIGVTYDPGNESQNYDLSLLPARYDGFVFFRDTRPLTFLD